VSNRVNSPFQVAEIIRAGLEKAFDCKIDFYADNTFIVTFYDHGDDMLTLKFVEERCFVIDSTTPTARTLSSVARTCANAESFMGVLQVEGDYS
jgi:hypothetical protein